MQPTHKRPYSHPRLVSTHGVMINPPFVNRHTPRKVDELPLFTDSKPDECEECSQEFYSSVVYPSPIVYNGPQYYSIGTQVNPLSFYAHSFYSEPPIEPENIQEPNPEDFPELRTVMSLFQVGYFNKCTVPSNNRSIEYKSRV